MAFQSGAISLKSRSSRRRRSCPIWMAADGKKLFGAVAGDPNAKKYRVVLNDPANGREYTADVPEDRYVLYYMAEQGLEVPAMCRNGCCTTCAAKIESGDVHQPEALGLLKELKEEGYALMCVSYPRSDIQATLQDEDEVYEKQFGSTFESGGTQFGGIIPEED